MKKALLAVCMIGFVAQSFAQDVLYSATIKKEEVPTVIVEAVERDYPGYSMEEFYAVPLEYVESNVYVNRNIDSIDDYDTFEIDLKGKGEELTATYNAEGKLMNTRAHAKNEKLPAAVRNAIAKEFPKWTMTRDSYVMSHYADGKKKERYRVMIKLGDDSMRIVTDENGKILNKPQISR